MANIVFLSPNFPSNYYQFCRALQELGANVLGIDHVPYESLQHPLRESLTEYYKVADLHHSQELMLACEAFIDRHGPIHRLESLNEHWLQTQAHLRTHFNIPGMKNHQIENVKRKSLMKKVFQAAGMHVARGALIPTLGSALALAEEVGYPTMIKPDIGVGACGCQKIHNEGELRGFFKEKSPQEYLMEEFIEGVIYSFDGLVDRQGKVIFYTAHAYSSGIAEIVQHQLDPFYYSLRHIPKDLEEIGRKTLDAFQVKESFFHFEYFRTKKDGGLRPIEVNMRPQGGVGLDMCNYACEINLYKLWAQVVIGSDIPISYERKYHCMSVNRRFKNSYAHSHEQIIKKWGHCIAHHEDINPLYAKVMGEYYYIVRSPDLEELFAIQHFIQAQNSGHF